MSEIVTSFLLAIVIVLVGIAYLQNRAISSFSGGFVFSPIPFILINYILIFFYRPFVILYYDASTLNFEEIDYERACQAVQLGLISLCAIMLPFVLPFHKKHFTIWNPKLANKKINNQKLVLLILFFSVLIVGGLSIYGSALNNTGHRMENPSEYKGFFIFIFVQRFHFVLSVLAFYFYISIQERHAWRLPLLICILVAPLLNLLAAGRGATFYLLIAYGVIYVFVRSLRISWKHVAYIGIIGVLFSILNFLLSTMRVVISASEWEWADVINAMDYTASAGKLEELLVLASWDYSVFDVLVTIVNRSDVYTFGSTNLEYLLSYVPRFIWSDKPYDQGFMLYVTNNFYSYVFSQTGSTFAGTIVGEGYLNFGIIGIVLYSFIFSAIFYHIYRKACLRINSNSIIIYALAFPVSQQVIRGGLDIVINFFLMILIPLWLMNSVLSKSSRHGGVNTSQMGSANK